MFCSKLLVLWVLYICCMLRTQAPVSAFSFCMPGQYYNSSTCIECDTNQPVYCPGDDIIHACSTCEAGYYPAKGCTISTDTFCSLCNANETCATVQPFKIVLSSSHEYIHKYVHGNKSKQYIAFLTDSVNHTFQLVNTGGMVFSVLVIGGGGAGSGSLSGGGGGAGALFFASDIVLPDGTYTAQVGRGGIWANGKTTRSCGATFASSWASENGHQSVLQLPSGKAITSPGGGGSWPGTCRVTYNAGHAVGVSGGSGGGSPCPYNYRAGIRDNKPGATTYGHGGQPLSVREEDCGGVVAPCADFMHGHRGGGVTYGSHITTHWRSGAGGGGAGGAASDVGTGWNAHSRDRNGGPGMMVNITGDGYWWAGGGGAGCSVYKGGCAAGYGGLGGGGGGAGDRTILSDTYVFWVDHSKAPTIFPAENIVPSLLQRAGKAAKNTGSGGGSTASSNIETVPERGGGDGGSGIIVLSFSSCPVVCPPRTVADCNGIEPPTCQPDCPSHSSFAETMQQNRVCFCYAGYMNFNNQSGPTQQDGGCSICPKGFLCTGNAQPSYCFCISTLWRFFFKLFCFELISHTLDVFFYGVALMSQAPTI